MQGRRVEHCQASQVCPSMISASGRIALAWVTRIATPLCNTPHHIQYPLQLDVQY